MRFTYFYQNKYTLTFETQIASPKKKIQLQINFLD